MRRCGAKITYGCIACAIIMGLSGCKGASLAGPHVEQTIVEEFPADHTKPTTNPVPDVEGDMDTIGVTVDLDAQMDYETTFENTTEEVIENTAEINTEVVAEEPTEAPTQEPTRAPTEAPVFLPTEAPTEAPTEMPTQAPTQAPTQVPTQAPTTHTEPQNAAKPFDVGSNNDVYEKAVSMYEANLKRAEKMLNLVNQYRVENGLKTLELNEKLCYAAGMRAVEMDYGNFFGHRRYNGADNFTTIQYVGIKYGKCGEILAANCINCDEAFNLWKNSPTHNKIILNEGYRKMGFGYCNKKGHMIWVIQFTD